jgi:trimeric autotransporter adhesin
MKSLFNFKMTASSLVSISPLVFLALSQIAQAVLPPPDGGYPGQNTAEGQSALLHLSGGTYNTALGWASLGFNVTGNYNTGVGAATLLNNTAAENTATGAGALLSNTVGDSNTATGAFALFSNTEGSTNTASGGRALFNNTMGDRNTADGYSSLNANTSGSDNTAIGYYALVSNTANGNTATGSQTLRENITGSGNTANGYQALTSNQGGIYNTAVGYGALRDNTTGSGNTALGYFAGRSITGSGNVCIGPSVLGVPGANDTTWIRNVYTSIATARQVYVDSDNRIGTLSSSRRYKEEIKPMDTVSETLFALKPVTFRYKKEIDRSRALSFGLIAEEVAMISPDLITRDEEGQPQTVRYEAINAMLLNEFLKEHKKVEQQGREISKQNTIISELESTVARQQKSFQSKLAEQQNQIEALRSGLQKVSVQLEMMKPGTQMVINEP